MTNIVRGRQTVLWLTNKSGGGVVAGDVVIISSGTASAFTTTTTPGLKTDVIGVVLDTSIANDADGRVCIFGYVPIINLSAAASLGDTFATHTVAKQATPAAARADGHFGQVLGTGSTPAAVLWGVPDGASAGGGMATDPLWDAAGDLAIGTGANTGAKLSIGTTMQILRVNSGATAPEWVSAGRVLINSSAPSGTGTVTFSSIPAIYNSLLLEFCGRSTKVQTIEDMSFYLNNDTTDGNYRSTVTLAYGTNSTVVVGGNTAFLGRLPAANAPANSAGAGIVRIIDYAGTTFKKQANGNSSFREVDGSGNQQLTLGYSYEWENTAAINRIDIVLAAGQYVAGTNFRLYGVF